MSQCLFDLFVNELIRGVFLDISGVLTGKLNMSVLSYADDIVLLLDDPDLHYIGIIMLQKL